MSATPSRPATTRDLHQFCTFWTAGHFYGIDILDIKEINTELQFTPISHAPATVKGYVNIRGQIHLILDLARLLGFPGTTDTQGQKLLIFKPAVAEPFGVLVDRIGDIITVPDRQIEFTTNGEGPEDVPSVRHHAVIGICKLPSDLLLILEPRALLKTLHTPT